MTVDLDKLEMRAKAADGMNWYTPEALPMSNCDAVDAAFIAAASPDVIVALVSEVRQLRARVAEMDIDWSKRHDPSFVVDSGIWFIHCSCGWEGSRHFRDDQLSMHEHIDHVDALAGGAR